MVLPGMLPTGGRSWLVPCHPPALETLRPFPPVPSLGPATVPAGHWRKYTQVLAAEFAVLAPVAARLGYPEV